MGLIVNNIEQRKWENTAVVCFKVSSKYLLEGRTNYKQFSSVFEEFCLLWHNSLLTAYFMFLSCFDYFLTLKIELTFTGLYDLISEKVELCNWEIISKYINVFWKLSQLIDNSFKFVAISSEMFLSFLYFPHLPYFHE
jgi:hypothetical protein